MPSVVTPRSQSVLMNSHVLPGRAVEPGCHLPLQWRGRGSLWLIVLLTTGFIADKPLQISEANPKFLIRLAFTGLVSTLWAHILNGAGSFREHIDAINSSAALSDKAKEQRGERGMSSRRAAWNVCMLERGTDVVFVAGVFVRQGVCVKFA